MAFYNEFRNLHLALERGNVDEFIDEFIEKLSNDTVKLELVTKTYSTRTRTLACVASHADTITQNLQLHGMLEKDSSSGTGSGSGDSTSYGRRGRNYQSRGRGRGGYSSKDVNVAAVDEVVETDDVHLGLLWTQVVF
jgi:hypothetical protein